MFTKIILGCWKYVLGTVVATERAQSTLGRVQIPLIAFISAETDSERKFNRLGPLGWGRGSGGALTFQNGPEILLRPPHSTYLAPHQIWEDLKTYGELYVK